ncbi:MAG: peroxiredoxin [Candidatus Melainabacteria bacterium]|nr:peroxiredoxin [Candidatus Melainabacteria bacterium]
MTTSTELQPLAVGTPAPDFDLPATGNRQVKLADFRGKNLIVVFYPKDQTPGCTKQLCALRDDVTLFEELNTTMIASNPDSLASHERFAEKESYPFPILVDADKTMARDYQALKPEGGIQRTVYIIDAEGIIRYAQQGLPSDAELADAIRAF